MRKINMNKDADDLIKFLQPYQIQANPSTVDRNER